MNEKQKQEKADDLEAKREAAREYAQAAMLSQQQMKFNFPTSRDIMLGYYKEALDYLGVTKKQQETQSMNVKIKMWEDMIKKMEKEKFAKGTLDKSAPKTDISNAKELRSSNIGAGGASMKPIPTNAKSVNPPFPDSAFDKFENVTSNFLEPYMIKAARAGAYLAKAAPAADLAFMAGNSMYDQVDAATGGYGNNVYDKEYGKSDPLSLRPVYDAILGDGNFAKRINDPEWVQRNPRSAALYNLLMSPVYASEGRKQSQYPAAFASAYTPEGLDAYFKETFKDENKAALEIPKFNFPVGMTPVR